VIPDGFAEDFSMTLHTHLVFAHAFPKSRLALLMTVVLSQ